jgi:hypothetical protein
MNKTGNVKLLNSTEGASSTVLLSRQIRASGATAGEGTGGSGFNPVLVDNLNRLMGAIRQYLADYIGYLTGDLQALPPNINATITQTMSTAFYQLKNNALMSTVYEDYRKFANSLIPAFQNITNQVIACNDINSKLEAALEKASILDDINKLKAYLDQLTRTHAIIPEQTVTVPLATIKEPYNTYIKMFGFPAGMLWDPDKIAFVYHYLNNQ